MEISHIIISELISLPLYGRIQVKWHRLQSFMANIGDSLLLESGKFGAIDSYYMTNRFLLFLSSKSINDVQSATCTLASVHME